MSTTEATTTLAVRGETTPDHIRAAAEVISEIQGLVGNLNLAGLLDAARNADRNWEETP